MDGLKELVRNSLEEIDESVISERISMFALKDNFYLAVEGSLINAVYIDIYQW